MNIERKEILAILKSDLVPFLRKNGFKGSMPNFYREHSGFCDLFNIQFYSSGGSFCINIGYADKERKNVSFKPDTEAKKLSVSQTKEQIRLGASSKKNDHWFSFGKTSSGEVRGEIASKEKIIFEIFSLFKSQAEPWWQEKYKNES